jgi:hypothetical protein
MRKALTLAAAIALVSSQAFATYVIVLKDGTRYKAKTKWTMSNGKALIQLESGGTVALNPGDIDVAQTDRVNKLGLGDVGIIAQETAQPSASSAAKQPSLGDAIRARRPAQPAATPSPATRAAAPAPVAAATTNPGQLDSEVLNKFERAYENVGIFEHKVVSTGANSLRADLTADNEDKVFNALSASAFLLVRNAGSDTAKIDMVEIFMKTTTGGASGRFQMTRADAEAIDKKVMTISDYFVRKVIF